MRLFIGAPVNEDVKKAIVSNYSLFSDARMTVKKNLHITLKFLGGCREEMKDEIIEVFNSCLAGVKPFEIRIEGFSGFPDEKNARIIWARINDSAGRIPDIYGKLEEGFSAAGFEGGKRPFIPHITAGRAKKSVDITAIKGKIALDITAEIDSIALYKSVLKQKNAEYTVIHEKFL